MNAFSIVVTRNAENRRDLEQLCEKLSTGLTMVEVGVYAGDSTAIFLSSGKIQNITCVDAWENDYDGNDICSFACPMQIAEASFDEKMQRFLKKGVEVRKLKCVSTEAAKAFLDRSLDLVYIDACHLYEAVKQDLEVWQSKVKSGGWIAGHDFNCPLFPGVAKAVLEVVGKPDFVFCTGSWMKKVA